MTNNDLQNVLKMEQHEPLKIRRVNSSVSEGKTVSTLLVLWT